MIFNGAQDSDGNRRAISGGLPFVSRSLWEFDASTTGAQGTHTVFNVTGDILFNIFATVETDLTGASALVGLGIDVNANGVVGDTPATDCDVGLVLTAGLGGSAGLFGLLNIATYSDMILNSGHDLALKVSTADVTGGALNIYAAWRPLSDGANVTVATPA